MPLCPSCLIYKKVSPVVRHLSYVICPTSTLMASYSFTLYSIYSAPMIIQFCNYDSRKLRSWFNEPWFTNISNLNNNEMLEELEEIFDCDDINPEFQSIWINRSFKCSRTQRLSPEWVHTPLLSLILLDVFPIMNGIECLFGWMFFFERSHKKRAMSFWPTFKFELRSGRCLGDLECVDALVLWLDVIHCQHMKKSSILDAHSVLSGIKDVATIFQPLGFHAWTFQKYDEFNRLDGEHDVIEDSTGDVRDGFCGENYTCENFNVLLLMKNWL